MNNKPLFEGKEVERLIPQRAPMVMVDTLYEATNTSVHSALTITSDNIFCQKGYFLEVGLIEHIAQTASLLFGYKAFTTKLPIPLGYIGEVKKCQIFALPKLGSTLDTYVSIVSEINNISLVKAQTYLCDQLQIECQMKLFVQAKQ